MRDTSPQVAELWQKLVMARSAEDRIYMTAAMFDTARMLALAQPDPRHSTKTPRQQLFIRLYSGDFDPATTQKILNRLN